MYTVFWNMALTLIFAFPIGYLVFSFQNQKTSSSNPLLMLPFYVAMGLTCWVPISFLLSLVHINRNIVLIIWGTTLAFLIYKKLVKKPVLSTKINIPDLKNLQLTHIIPALLFVFSFLIFAIFAFNLKWPAPGDMVTHSTLISVILDQGKVPLSDPNIGLQSVGVSLSYKNYMDPGFLVLSASVSMVTNLPPAQSALILVACISTLIPLLLYGMVYTETKSIFFSILAFLLAYILPGNYFSLDQTHDILAANILNGTFPSHFGNFILILFFYVFAFRNRLDKLPILLISFSLILTYPPYFNFIPFCLIVSSIISMKKHFKHSSTTKTFFNITRKNIIFLMVIITGSLILVIFREQLWNMVQIVYDGRNAYRIHNRLKNPILFMLPYVLMPLFLWKEKSKISLLYLCILTIFVLNLNNWFFDAFFWIFFPSRSFSAFMALFYVVLGVSLHLLLKNLSSFIGFNHLFSKYITRIVSKNMRLLGLISTSFILVLMFSPTFQQYVSYKQSTWGKPLENDYQVMEWIKENVSDQDLIFNERTFVGLYLPSFSAKKVVNFFTLGRGNHIHGKIMYECNQISDNPGNYDLVRDLLRKYDIKYIFIGSDRAYLNFGYTPKNDGYSYRWSMQRGYVYRNWWTSEYLEFFDNNPYLELALKAGGSAVYRVHPELSFPLSNMLTYPSFENESLPEEYETISEGSENVKLVDNEHRSGNYSIRMQYVQEYETGYMLEQTANYSGIRTILNVTNENLFKIDLWTKGRDLKDRPLLHGSIYYEDGSKEYYELGLHKGSFDWSFYTVVVMSDPAKTVKTLEVNVGIQWSEHSGIFWVDDLGVFPLNR